jgi:hypothetical protein
MTEFTAQLERVGPFVRNWWSLIWSRNIPPFKEADGFVPSPQEPANGPFLKPVESNLHRHNPLFGKKFNIILPSTCGVNKWPFPLGYQTKIFYILIVSILCTAYPTISILIEFIALIMFCEHYDL